MTYNYILIKIDRMRYLLVKMENSKEVEIIQI